MPNNITPNFEELAKNNTREVLKRTLSKEDWRAFLNYELFNKVYRKDGE